MVASTTTVQSVFQDAVRSTSTHRKNVAALLKLLKRLGPSDFLASLEDCVLRILAFGKGVAEADRAVTFVGAFLGACRGLDDSGAALARVASMLLPLSLRGLSAALKAVRFRSCQILASLLNTVDEITYV
ncbi:chromosome condensation complex Condensin, subunit G [Polyrhizophydium stewartii]|uniref:Chromosome condensation complex Condensin, subunit G n=1 Tax=Polyrhizophydium stewartii TaxID=2732419 RepID=A0ABR4MVK9_9FUNG|nr:hypothetical protein HK105_003508 [Polyrhizophydium stewartii]